MGPMQKEENRGLWSTQEHTKNPKPSVSLFVACQDTMVHPRVFLSLCRCLKSGPQPRDHNLSSHRIFLLPLPYYCLPSSGELQHKNHCFFSKKWTIPKWFGLAALESNQFSSFVPVLSPKFLTPKPPITCEKKIDRKDRSVDRSKNRLAHNCRGWNSQSKGHRPPRSAPHGWTPRFSHVFRCIPT